MLSLSLTPHSTKTTLENLPAAWLEQVGAFQVFALLNFNWTPACYHMSVPLACVVLFPPVLFYSSIFIYLFKNDFLLIFSLASLPAIKTLVFLMACL